MTDKLKTDIIPLSQVPKNDVTLVSGKKPRVLIVDDERVIADTLSIILSKSGFEVMTAYDGSDALALATKAAPDLLISDVVMPEMSGIDLAITLTHMIPACKILLFSGQAATSDLLAKARTDGHDFTTLTKPIHPTDMLQRVRECLATGRAGTQPWPQLFDDNPAVVTRH